MEANLSEFLKQEIRNGYLVSEKMKKIWSLEIDILKEIKKICERHNIEYFAICGTLIGAVRENGFIPWDDDIDLGMTRENANKFVKFARLELPNGYCLVGNEITKNFFRPHLQVRDSETTVLTKADYKLKYCKGCWVDIFIFDKFPIQDNLNKKFRKKIGFMNKFLHFYTFYRSSDSKIKRFAKFCLSRIYILLNGGINHTIKKYDNLCAKYNNLEKDFYYDYLAFKPQRTLKINPIAFSEFVDHKFEYTTIKIPKNFNDALVPEYGEDYMVRKKAPNGHGNLFLDPENSYIFYEKLSRKEYYKLFDRGDEL